MKRWSALNSISPFVNTNAPQLTPLPLTEYYTLKKTFLVCYYLLLYVQQSIIH